MSGNTPVQRQYWELKKQNPDAILFFRLGDFYEMFFEDAKICSRILGITLTARHKGTENEMPMAGVPYHSYKEYLENLIAQGYKVAIAEQTKNPDGTITRQVDRTITPGTNQGEHLNPGQNNFLVGVMVSYSDKKYAIAVSDLSTGYFQTSSFTDEIQFFDEIYKLAPKEILIESEVFEDETFCQKLPKSLITPRKKISTKSSKILLQEHFGLSNLESFGIETLFQQIESAAMVMKYLEETQKSNLKHIKKITPYQPDQYMHLDHQTFRHLEIFNPLQPEEKKATLISVFDRPFTPMGCRKIKQWMVHPLKEITEINQRLWGVSELFDDFEKIQNLSENLKKIPDIERILSRISTGTGNPREVYFLKEAFGVFPHLKNLLESSKSEILKTDLNLFSDFERLFQKLDSQLSPNPPLEITSGGIFKSEVDKKLEALRSLAKNAQDWLAEFLAQKKSESGITTLRVKYAKNFGFCLEVSKGQVSKVPENWTRKQTLVNAERFSTPELAEYETKILSAEEEAFALEHRLFLELRSEILKETEKIQKVSEKLAQIDTLLSLARTAKNNRWNQPEISEKNIPFHIQEGRHPVVEKLSPQGFIANDLTLSDQNYMHLITGPNMAGKSTYLRQNALIILLGQMGSFVPAKKASWSLFDRVFTRVGASDNLAAGKSTFFVEMTETAHILNAATEKSFLILDEIGRGTSTFDGVALAWAILDFLHHEIKSKTLFATHYHELIDLAENLPQASNYHISVTQNEGGIVFLRKIKKGGISDSFGIEVARLAGVPKKIIKQSREILSQLESENLLTQTPNLFNIPRNTNPLADHRDLEPLAQKKEADQTQKDPLQDFLKNINPDDMTPKKALEKWYELKKLEKITKKL